jgi:hypothetical protein
LASPLNNADATGAIGILTLTDGIWLTNRYKTRWLVILLVTPPAIDLHSLFVSCIVLAPIAGAAALTKINSSDPVALIGAYYVIWLYGGPA